MIYFMRAEGVGLIKIGFTADQTVDRRLLGVRTMSPVSVVLVGTTPGDQARETDIHRRFRHIRSHGEWFWPTRELLDFIQDQIAPGEERDALAFRAVRPLRPRPWRGLVVKVYCPPGFKAWFYRLAETQRISSLVLMDAGLRIIALKNGWPLPPELPPHLRATPERWHYFTNTTVTLVPPPEWRAWLEGLATKLRIDLNKTLRLAAAAFARSVGDDGCPLAERDQIYEPLLR